MRRLLRVLRVLALTTVLAIAALFLAIKTTMWVTRIHIAHLLADFQSIQPMQSTWPDAQRLMHRWGRWGRWGHYNGTCTATDCAYTIGVYDGISQFLQNHLSENASGFMANHGIGSFLGKLGFHYTFFEVHLAVQDGIIVRTHTTFLLDVTPHFVSSDWNQDYALISKTQVHARLTTPAYSPDLAFAYVAGPPVPSLDHPDYKVGAPSGCTICMAAHLTYTPTLAHNELVRLTSYNLSCITAVRQCRTLDDLLPAAAEWRLYEGWDDPNYHAPPQPAPAACQSSPRALARDADLVFQATVISTRSEQHQDGPSDKPFTRQLATVRATNTLKPFPGFHLDEQIVLMPFTYQPNRSFDYTTEQLQSGRHVILLLTGGYPSIEPDFEIPPCGILPDDPATLAQVRLGISQDTPVRHGDGYDN